MNPCLFSKVKMATTILLMVLCVFASMFVWLWHAQPAHAFSGIMTYQGKLADSSGVAVADGSYDIKLTLYNAASGGSCQYTVSGTCGTPTALSVTVTDGLFSVELGGSGTNAIDPTIFQTGDLYLGVTVEADSEMTPRKQLTNVGFAYNALYLSGLATSTTGGTSSFIPAADTNGNFVFTGTPQSTAGSGAVLYINPAAATSDFILLGLAVTDSVKFTVDEDGDVVIAGSFTTGGDILPSANNSYDLGSHTAAFTDIFASGTTYTNNLTILGSCTGCGNAGLTDNGTVINLTTDTDNIALATTTANGLLHLQSLVDESPLVITATSTQTSYLTRWHSVGSADPVAYMTAAGSLRTSSSVQVTAESNFYETIYIDPNAQASVVGNPLLVIGSTGAVGDSSIYIKRAQDVNTIEGQIIIQDAGGFGNRLVFGYDDTGASDSTGLAVISSTYTTPGVTATDLDINAARIRLLGRAAGAHETATLTTPAVTITNDEDTNGPILALEEQTSDRLYVYATDTKEVLFRSLVTDQAGVGAFVFDTNSTLTTAENRSLLMVRNNGTEKFSINANGDFYTSGTAYVDNLTVDQTILFGTSTAHYASSTLQASSADFSLKGGLTQVPTDPVLIGSITHGTNLNSISNIRTVGSYAYVIGGGASGFLRILDVSDPTNPKIIGGVTDALNLNDPSGLFVTGKYAYVAASSDDSLQVIDVSNPTLPKIVGEAQDNTLLDGITDVYVTGKYAYVVNNTDDSLRIIDISDPTSPVLVGGVKDASTLNQPVSVKVLGKYAYVAARSDQRLVILDVSDPHNPYIVGSVQDVTNLIAIQDVYVTGRYAYTVGGSTNAYFNVIDVSDPTSPTILATRQDDTTLAGLGKVEVAGNYAYYNAGADDSIRVIEITNPLNPTLLHNFQDATNLDGVGFFHLVGKYLYVSSGNADTVSILDMSGTRLPLAHIGSLEGNNFNFLNNGYIGSDLDVGTSLSVGSGGIWTQGSVNILGDVSFGSSSMFTSVPTNSSGNNGFTFATLNTEIDQGDFLRFATSSKSGELGDLMFWGYALQGGQLATTTFTSAVANIAGATAFEFNSENTLTSSSTSLDRTLLTVSNNGVPKFHVGAGGNVYAKDSFIANSSDFGIGDLAEYVDLTPGQQVDSGDVITPDPQNPGKFIKVTEAYSSSVAGIISNTAAFVMGARGENRAALALAGLVFTHVSDENGPIEVGDMLVTASEPGYLMKYDPAQAAGVNAVIVATAIEPHQEGLGTIKSLVRAAAFTGTSTLTVAENSDGTLTTAGEHDIIASSISSTRGTWSVDEEGNVRVKRIVAEEYVVDQNESAPTIGEGVFETGQYFKQIKTPAVQEHSKIFVSFLTNLGGRSYHISEKIAGDSFTVMLSSEVSEFTYFDWWIVQKDGDAPQLEAEQSPPVPYGEEDVEEVSIEQAEEDPIPTYEELAEENPQPQTEDKDEEIVESEQPQEPEVNEPPQEQTEEVEQQANEQDTQEGDEQSAQVQQPEEQNNEPAVQETPVQETDEPEEQPQQAEQSEVTAEEPQPQTQQPSEAQPQPEQKIEAPEPASEPPTEAAPETQTSAE